MEWWTKHLVSRQANLLGQVFCSPTGGINLPANRVLRRYASTRAKLA